MKMSRRLLGGGVAAGLAVVAVAGCGSSSHSTSASGGNATSTASAAANVSGTGSLHATSNKQIVYFSLGLSNLYVTNFQKGLRKVLTQYGYNLKTYDSNLNQATFDQEAQQFLATGQKPAGIVWEPPAPGATNALASQMAKLAPVIDASQTPIPTGAYGYAAASQPLVGTEMGKLLLQARAYALSKGVKLHSKQGNVIYFDGSLAQPAQPQRWNAILAATKSAPFNFIAHAYAVQDGDQGYQVASPLLPKYKDKVDFILVFNLDAATGVVRAAQQAGYQLGKNVFIVSGDCGGGEVNELSNGTVYSTVVDSGYTEGELVAASLIERIATGKSTSGTDYVPLGPNLPAITMTPPARYVYQPTPGMTASQLNTPYLGSTYASACTVG